MDDGVLGECEKQAQISERKQGEEAGTAGDQREAGAGSRHAIAAMG